jgi:hypothetical protein
LDAHKASVANVIFNKTSWNSSLPF